MRRVWINCSSGSPDLTFQRRPFRFVPRFAVEFEAVASFVEKFADGLQFVFLKQFSAQRFPGKLKHGDRGTFPVFIVRLAGMKGVRNVRTVHEQGPFTQGTDVISGETASVAKMSPVPLCRFFKANTEKL